MSVEIPEVGWIEATDNPWRVRLLDVRPVTQHMVSASSDPECAANALSYAWDSGAGFICDETPIQRSITTSLPYRKDEEFWGGALFRPSVMEHKWAIFYHFERLFFVRSWQRKVYVIAETKNLGDFLEVRSIQGTFVAQEEPPDFTCRVLDYLMRTHTLNLEYPAPLLPDLATDTQQAALWCFSAYGCMAHFAALKDPGHAPPVEPLRILSLSSF
jgi:hypothetical protein